MCVYATDYLDISYLRNSRLKPIDGLLFCGCSRKWNKCVFFTCITLLFQCKYEIIIICDQIVIVGRLEPFGAFNLCYDVKIVRELNYINSYWKVFHFTKIIPLYSFNVLFIELRAISFKKCVHTFFFRTGTKW